MDLLPPIVTESFNHVAKVVYWFMGISVTGAFVGMVLARMFGGKSQLLRQAIFSIIMFLGLCIAAFVAYSKIKAG